MFFQIFSFDELNCSCATGSSDRGTKICSFLCQGGCLTNALWSSKQVRKPLGWMDMQASLQRSTLPESKSMGAKSSHSPWNRNSHDGCAFMILLQATASPGYLKLVCRLLSSQCHLINHILTNHCLSAVYSISKLKDKSGILQERNRKEAATV